MPAASEDRAERTWREADALAVRFQRRTLWAMRAIHVLAVAMGLALLMYSDLGAPDPMLWVFLALFALGLGIAADRAPAATGTASTSTTARSPKACACRRSGAARG